MPSPRIVFAIAAGLGTIVVLALLFSRQWPGDHFQETLLIGLGLTAVGAASLTGVVELVASFVGPQRTVRIDTDRGLVVENLAAPFGLGRTREWPLADLHAVEIAPNDRSLEEPEFDLVALLSGHPVLRLARCGDVVEAAGEAARLRRRLALG